MSDVSRFKLAQDGSAPPGLGGATFDIAIRELATGQKRDHWMWYVFPQIKLGHSDKSNYYAISSLGEAKAYLEDAVLADRYAKCLDLVAARVISESNDGDQIWRKLRDLFGCTDRQKFKSSVTLFEAVAPRSADPAFQVVENLIAGFRVAGLRPCQKTTDWLNRQSG